MACRLVGAKPFSAPMLDLLIEPLRTNFSKQFFYRNSYIFIPENAFENVAWKLCHFVAVSMG